jgi:phosphate uptake regulator
MSSDRETRKVQLAGNSTYTVSLPKAWADDRGIEPGMEVAVWPLDHGVLVGPTPGTETFEWNLDCESVSPAAAATVVRETYVAGADRVCLHAASGLDQRTRRAVDDATTGLVGLSVTGETDRSLRLDCALDPEKFPPERTLLQLRHAGLSMFTDATRAVATDDPELAAAVVERLPEVERQARVVLRYCNRSLVDVRALAALDVDRPTLFDHGFGTRCLCRVARFARDIAALECPDGTTWPDGAEAQARAAGRLVEDAVDALVSADDVSAAVGLVEDAEELHGEVADSHDAVYAGTGGPAVGRTLERVERTVCVARSLGRRAVRASVRE